MCSSATLETKFQNCIHLHYETFVLQAHKYQYIYSRIASRCFCLLGCATWQIGKATWYHKRAMTAYSWTSSKLSLQQSLLVNRQSLPRTNKPLMYQPIQYLCITLYHIIPNFNILSLLITIQWITL